MRVLTIYAHPNPRSFCHEVLVRFTQGLAEAGHTSEVVDLYAMHFDPVWSARDAPNWIDETIPEEMLARSNLRNDILQSAKNPLARFLIRRWLRGKDDDRAIIRALRAERSPSDVVEQQRKVAAADALAFIAPVWFVGFPAILKGWFDRVFTLGFAFGLSPEGWRGDVKGRIPLLTHEKALIIQPTIFDENAYAAGFGDAMRRTIDEWCLVYPGIKHVEHVFFHAVHGADDATRRAYLARAYRLGLDFASADEVVHPVPDAPRARGAEPRLQR